MKARVWAMISADLQMASAITGQTNLIDQKKPYWGPKIVGPQQGLIAAAARSAYILCDELQANTLAS
jgi:hypothetical protein